jgi:hypothetical protein
MNINNSTDTIPIIKVTIFITEWPPRSSVKQPSDPLPSALEEIKESIQDNEANSENAVIIEAAKEQDKKDGETPTDSEDVEETESEREATKALENSEQPENAEKVDYSGAQVWKVSTDKSGVRQIITRLRRRNRKYY